MHYEILEARKHSQPAISATSAQGKVNKKKCSILMNLSETKRKWTKLNSDIPAGAQECNL